MQRCYTSPRGENRPSSQYGMEPELRIHPRGFPLESMQVRNCPGRASKAEQYVVLFGDNSQCHKQGSRQASTGGTGIIEP